MLPVIGMACQVIQPRRVSLGYRASTDGANGYADHVAPPQSMGLELRAVRTFIPLFPRNAGNARSRNGVRHGLLRSGKSKGPVVGALSESHLSREGETRNKS